MMKNISTKTKLMLLPLAFIAVVVISGIVFNYYNNIADKRAEAAMQTDVFIQEVLKGRISVYQFLRAPNDQTAQKVRDDFAKLNNHVIELKPKLSAQKNKDLCDDILNLSKEYIVTFDTAAKLKMDSFNTGIKEDTEEIKTAIKSAAKVGGELEAKLLEINKSAIELKEQSVQTLNTMLIAIAILSIIFFITISLFLSNQILTSLSNFQKGLLSFFKYLNKETMSAEVLDDSTQDEFGHMAKFVNENIKRTEDTINKDNALIEDAKVVMSRVSNGWYSQFIEKSTPNQSLEDFKNNVNTMIKSTR
ncbi:MAG: chemotaxis protein, partial [Arcobacteraceae bacterium]|nr:chemotaxis protein [Arcobacteraceae bacterium]